jgi:hypothetical protein
MRRGRRAGATAAAPVAVTVALVVAIAALAAIAAWQTVEAYRSERREAAAEARAGAALAASRASRVIDDRLRLVRELTGRTDVRAAVRRGDWGSVRPVLDEAIAAAPDVDSVVLVDADGRVRGRADRDNDLFDPPLERAFPNAPWFRGAVASAPRPFVSEIYVYGRIRCFGTSGGELDCGATPKGVAVADAVAAQGGQVGAVLQVTTPTRNLTDAVGDPTDARSPVQAFDAAGHPLLGIDATPRRAYADAPGVREALAGDAGDGYVDLPGTAGSFAVGYVPVRAAGWAVLSGRPAPERPWLVLAAIGIVGAVAAALAVLLATRIPRRGDDAARRMTD